MLDETINLIYLNIEIYKIKVLLKRFCKQIIPVVVLWNKEYNTNHCLPPGLLLFIQKLFKNQKSKSLAAIFCIKILYNSGDHVE